MARRSIQKAIRQIALEPLKPVWSGTITYNKRAEKEVGSSVLSDAKFSIYEYPPKLRTIRIAGTDVELYSRVQRRPDRVSVNRYLAFPYTFFVVTHSERFRRRDKCFEYCDGCSRLGVYWSKTPFLTIDEEVRLPLLPNIFHSGEVCLGDSLDYDADDMEIINNFWQAPFDTEDRPEIWDEYVRLTNTPLESYELWEEISLKDPQRIIEMDWSQLTLASIRLSIGYMLGLNENWYRWSHRNE